MIELRELRSSGLMRRRWLASGAATKSSDSKTRAGIRAQETASLSLSISLALNQVDAAQ